MLSTARVDGGVLPVMAVMESVGPRPRHTVTIGDGMATCHDAWPAAAALSATAASAIIEGVRQAGPALLGGRLSAVMHGKLRWLDVGSPVVIDGMTVRTGDIIHADINGVLVIPWAVADQVYDKAVAVRQRETRALRQLAPGLVYTHRRVLVADSRLGTPSGDSYMATALVSVTDRRNSMALTGLQIYKLLPQTNCRECGFPTCLAFAMKLAAKQAELSACPYVSAAGQGSARGSLAAADPPDHSQPRWPQARGRQRDRPLSPREDVLPPARLSCARQGHAADCRGREDGRVRRELQGRLRRPQAALRRRRCRERSRAMPATFAACVKAVMAKTKYPLILMAKDAKAMAAGLEAAAGTTSLDLRRRRRQLAGHGRAGQEVQGAAGRQGQLGPGRAGRAVAAGQGCRRRGHRARSRCAGRARRP